VKDLLPPNPEGQKGLLDGILKIPLETLLKSLSEGVAALYNNHRKDGEAARERLRTRLEAERWPDFIKVEAPL
jgi:hypothetical protein